MGYFPIDMSPVSFEWGVFVWLEPHPLAHNTFGSTYQQEALLGVNLNLDKYYDNVYLFIKSYTNTSVGT